MERIGSFNVYQNNYYEKTAKTGKDAAGAKASETKGANSTKETKTPELSQAAQKLLKELQKTYKNMDFMVADYESDEEAAAYLAKGTNEYSVLLNSEELEKMAADSSVKEKNLKTLDDAVSQLKDMEKQVAGKGSEVTRMGISMGKDGEVSFFAELEKSSKQQRERIEKHREENREAQKKADKTDKKAGAEKPEEALEKYKPGQPGSKRTTVFASSVEELAEKINQVDWNNVQSDPYNPVGQRFNLGI